MINRIYQGRANSLKMLEDGKKGKDPADWQEVSDFTEPLLQHHSVFQDAINYYIFALASLADSKHAEGEPFIVNLHARVQESWEKFPRPDAPSDAKSLRDSLRPWLNLPTDCSLEDGFRKVLVDDSEPEDECLEHRCLALYALLTDLGGASSIQQGGPTYLPYFCVKETKANFPRSSSKRLKAEGLTIVPDLVWKQTDPASASSLQELHSKLRMEYFAVPSSEGKHLTETQVKVKLLWAVQWLVDRGHLRNLDAWIAKIDAQPLPELRAHGAVNKDALKDRFAAWLIFNFVEQSAETYSLLKAVVPEPKKTKAKKAVHHTRLQAKLAEVTEDPILLARGDRGYVFPAFTALPAWKPGSPGHPVWRDFDIAAFKEALKAFNQFNQMTEKREEEKAKIRAAINWMTAENAERPEEDADDQDSVALAQVPRLVGDPRYELVKNLELDVARSIFGEGGVFHVTRSGLRGFRDLREKWNKLHRKHDGAVSKEKLQEVVKEYQRSGNHQYEVGATILFFTLCEEQYWGLWLEEEESAIDQRKAEGRAVNMLFAVAKLHELKANLKHKSEPVRLTPAEPQYSRRLYSFSDVMTTNQQKVGLMRSMLQGECAVSLAHHDAATGQISKRSARIGFKAPRMHRDHLLEDAETRWLQPMVEAFKLEDKVSLEAFEKVALALMPDWWEKKGSVHRRCLLNFAVSLDSAPLTNAIKKQSSLTGQSLGQLDKQLNGTQDKHVHLHWPETAKNAEDINWFSQQGFLVNGLQILSVDLGQRSAGAWALVAVAHSKPASEKRPSVCIGEAGGLKWYATATDFGVFKLPGENETDVRRGKNTPTKKGRGASDSETAEAYQLAEDFGLHAETARKWISPKHKFPEQNDHLIKIAGRGLSRLLTYHQWSCFEPEKIQDAVKRHDAIDKRINELAAYTGHQDLKNSLQAADFKGFRSGVAKYFTSLRDQLELSLVQLANRVVPLRDRSWEWRGAEKQLTDTGTAPEAKPKIIGQRGVSLKRIEQLEGLRKLFLRFNRATEREAHKQVAFGTEDAGRRSGEPCWLLLAKIDRLKEERLNQTAHGILAQALGVRLTTKTDKDLTTEELRRRDLHGVYERIPNRRPVDVIVLEDLMSYSTTHDRAPGENKKLMNWSHRAVLDKVKMLAEPFGTPVLEVAAAYSSRFDSRSFQPGFRAVDVWEVSDHMLASFRSNIEKEKVGSTKREQLRSILEQLLLIRLVNAPRKESEKDPLTLLLPQRGGPIFIPITEGSPLQADINAAINLGFRSVASPFCFKVHARIRALRKVAKGGAVTWELRASPGQQANKREQAAFNHKPKVVLDSLGKPPSDQLCKASAPNFFHDPNSIAQFDNGRIEMLQGDALRVSSGVAIWSHVKQQELSRCLKLNQLRIDKWLEKGIITQSDRSKAQHLCDKELATTDEI